jgi:hypothetical protein
MIFAASMVAALLAVAGCTERRDRSNLLTSIPTEEITFSMKKTVTGDLAITVPKSYVYDYGGGDQRDNFFFTDPADTSSVQRGMIYLSIGPTPVTFIPDSIEVMKTGGRIAGEDLEWREAIDTVEGGVRLFQKEAIARTLLKSYPSPGTKEGYILQAMVVGSDEVLVERLMAAVESIHPVKKGNL